MNLDEIIKDDETVSKKQAVSEVRMMAYQFADLYFAFVDEIRTEYGEEAAMKMAHKVLYRRAVERAEKMRERAEEKKLEKIPDNIAAVVDVPFLGWIPELGKDLCPYGAAWNKRIEENPWFRPFAAMYCSVTDTTVAEEFTGAYSHRVVKSTAAGDETCTNEYFLSDDVKKGKRTYRPEE